MLWGKYIKVFTDHTNLMRDAVGLTLDQVYQWRLLLEEYGPKIVYIKGIHNTMADAVSRLEYDPSINRTAESFHTTKVRNNMLGTSLRGTYVMYPYCESPEDRALGSPKCCLIRYLMPMRMRMQFPCTKIHVE